ncbi:MAG: ribonucleotide-diphosphate reductase subunit alpha, partial [Pseudomonadota bacterium]
MDFKASDGVRGETDMTDVTSDAQTGDQIGSAADQKDDKAMTMQKTDAGSDALIAAKGAEALGTAMAAAAKEAATPDSKKVNDRRFDIQIDTSRDAN